MHNVCIPIQLALELPTLQSGKFVCNFIVSSPYPWNSIQGTGHITLQYLFIEIHLNINGPMQFKPMSFKRLQSLLSRALNKYILDRHVSLIFCLFAFYCCFLRGLLSFAFQITNSLFHSAHSANSFLSLKFHSSRIVSTKIMIRSII